MVGREQGKRVRTCVRPCGDREEAGHTSKDRSRGEPGEAGADEFAGSPGPAWRLPRAEMTVGRPSGARASSLCQGLSRVRSRVAALGAEFMSLIIWDEEEGAGAGDAGAKLTEITAESANTRS